MADTQYNPELPMKDLEFSAKKIVNLLDRSEPIPEDPFFIEVGFFSSSLNKLLKYYTIVPASEKDNLRPIVNYFRQIQNYLVFLVRFPDILRVPHHAEIEQTLSIMKNREKWINEVYRDISQSEKEILNGSFKVKLEKLFEKKNLLS
jgi:hypothetical protein